jgi:hypothetical protein
MQILYFAIAIVVSATLGWFGGSLYGAKDCVADRQVKNAQVKTAAAKDDAKSKVRGAQRAVQRAQDRRLPTRSNRRSPMMFKQTLLLLSASLLLAGCPGSTLSLIKRTPPQECMNEVPPLKPLPTGKQNEEEAWIADAAPKYRDLAEDYHCLQDWATTEPQSNDDE